jgi:ethanolamine ammonia-lyase small subunit
MNDRKQEQPQSGRKRSFDPASRSDQPPDLSSRPEEPIALSSQPEQSDELSSRPDPERSEGEAERSALSATSASEQSPQAEYIPHPLTQLRQFTAARIALGRTGSSLPTKELLEFNIDHAIARDAVHAPLDAQTITRQLTAHRLQCIEVHSAALDRGTYLRRPDLGRKLDEPSRELLLSFHLKARPEVVFILADGLAAAAPQRYAMPVIEAVLPWLADWQIGPVVIAHQARVAIGDEIGEHLGATITVVLIGERPGLSSPDSLGIYLTYGPKPDRTDAERNCISNVREEGMNPAQAAQTLLHLLTRARRLKLSGIQLKDESGLSTQTALPH